ncbi:spermatogenesis-associated protein 25 [Python bivittatus]|uniref:Spermatogenesis-associated protein 25 n=1 Tax=Python bivittatus TaxID=176946 RepID=A0A9F5J694_PYTBI|nr:spermatogenesis-associated protein 25 [Python bivittatus]
MAYCGLGKASSASFPPPHQGESTSSSSSSRTKGAPRSRPSLFARMPREASPSAGIPCAAGLLRRKLPAKQAMPLQRSTLRPPQEPGLPQPCVGGCPVPGALQQGRVACWEPHRGSCCRLPLQNAAQEYPLEHPGDRWLYLSSAPPRPLQQQSSSGGDFALARWGFLPSGLFVVSAKLSRERDAQPRLPLSSNICILTLAMMIAGIPTIPVPGVREEDMIHAAQCFMAENLNSGEVQGEGAQRRSWSALQRLGPSCKRGRQRRRATHQSLLPLFLAQLEK